MSREILLSQLCQGRRQVSRFVRARDGKVFFYPDEKPDGYGYLAMTTRKPGVRVGRYRRRTWLDSDTVIDPNGTHFYPAEDDPPETDQEEDGCA